MTPRQEANARAQWPHAFNEGTPWQVSAYRLANRGVSLDDALKAILGPPETPSVDALERWYALGD